jgi:hypothetical protein
VLADSRASRQEARRHGALGEHVFNLEGGKVSKAGQPARSSGGYTLNPKGQPHSARSGRKRPGED